MDKINGEHQDCDLKIKSCLDYRRLLNSKSRLDTSLVAGAVS